MSASHKNPGAAGGHELARSNEPIVWSLFGGGGMMSALFGPMLVLITTILVPLGILLPTETMSYQRVLSFVQWWPGKLAVFVLVFLFMFHAMHRIYHSLHDLGIHGGKPAFIICYGFAALMSVVTGMLLLTF